MYDLAEISEQEAHAIMELTRARCLPTSPGVQQHSCRAVSLGDPCPMPVSADVARCRPPSCAGFRCHSAATKIKARPPSWRSGP